MSLDLPFVDGVEVVPFRLAEAPGGRDRYAEERAQAQAAGYAEGWASGKRAANLELDRRLADIDAANARDAEQRRQEQTQALHAITAASAQLDARQAPLLEEVTTAILSVAVELAEGLLHRELSTEGETARVAIRRCLAAVGEARPVTISVSSVDAETLSGADLPDGVRLQVDPTIQPGDAIAVHADGSVDARLSSALERVREVLHQ